LGPVAFLSILLEAI
jgi:hypothetical protein